MAALVTLSEFVMDRQSDFPYASGDLTRLLSDIGIAGKIINHKVNKAGLQDILGSAANINVQGETQMKLDVFSDETLLNAMRWGGQVAGAGSEENEKYFAFDLERCKKAKYVILFDPLDGSSNIDVNVSIGTIFSIFRRKSSIGDLANVNDFLGSRVNGAIAHYIISGANESRTGYDSNGQAIDQVILIGTPT